MLYHHLHIFLIIEGNKYKHNRFTASDCMQSLNLQNGTSRHFSNTLLLQRNIIQDYEIGIDGFNFSKLHIYQ